MSRKEYRDVYTVVISPWHRIVVDGEGMIYVDSQSRQCISNVDKFKDGLDEARRFVSAVFPSDPDRSLPLRFPSAERIEGYQALWGEGKMADKAGFMAANLLTAFLTDWKAVESLAGEGHRPHVTMNDYAKEWEKWW
jgi:hypothetical protein